MTFRNVDHEPRPHGPRPQPCNAQALANDTPAANDDALKAKLEAAFTELSGMVKELEGRCNNVLAELKTSVIQAVDPKLASL